LFTSVDNRSEGSALARGYVPRPMLFKIGSSIDSGAPLSLYKSLRTEGRSFLLESVEKSDQRARFSFVGAGPKAVVTVKNRIFEVEFSREDSELKDILASRLCSFANVVEEDSTLKGMINEEIDLFDALRCTIPTSDYRTRFGRQAFLGGGIGYLAYDLVRERFGQISSSSTPDAQFGIFNSAVIFDHLKDEVFLSLAPFAEDDVQAMAEEAESLLSELEPESTLSGDLGAESVEAGLAEPFEDSIREAKEHILEGDIFQVVLSRKARIKLKNPDPILLYKRLRKINPSPYTYIFEFGNRTIVGASPETLFSVYDRNLTVNPIAGTCPRGSSPEEDELLARKMLDDEKERAEHVMLVDLGRNDVRCVSKSGTVKVEDFMSVLRYSHVQHIETTVRGALREECDQFDAARATFPAGTLSGAPKLRAMEIIDDLEGEPRGIYGGGVGYFSSDGSADFAIAIRSIVLEGDEAVVQAGAGIVSDSDPHNEYMETERKMAAMKRALGVCE